MKILFWDTETTGLIGDPELRITELAMVLYDTKAKRILSSFGGLVDELAEGQKIRPEITELTGITTEMVKENGGSFPTVHRVFGNAMALADALFARNGLRFDNEVWALSCKRHNLEYNISKTTIDDYYDIPYTGKGRNLSHIAADHGFVNPFPHNALGDVLTLVRVASQYNLEAAYELAKTPLVKVQAKVSYDDKELAKIAGFTWNPEQKLWLKTLRRGAVDQLREDCQFDMKEIG